jgi:hypothetical protein
MVRDWFPHSDAEVQAELLTALGQDEMYPWQPSQARDYFIAQQSFWPEDWLADGELARRGQVLLQAMHQGWQALSLGQQLRQALAERFVTVPVGWLEKICDDAARFVGEQVTETERLIACVQGCLVNWSIEDLQILARPYAYAMRGSQVESTQDERAWVELSALEQAKLSFAIAKAALQMAQQYQDTLQ